MNLKIDRVLPYPPSLAEPYILTFLPSLQALLLYPTPPPPQEKPEEPKKKFGFKANSNAAPTMEEVFIFELSRGGWRTQETKGKFPTRRQSPAVACMGPCLMVYGGRQLAPAKQVNDLYCLHLATWQWKKLFAMQAPAPAPNSLALAISDDSLLVIGKELWVFSAKGVNWELEKGDLPGGIWEKIQGSELSLELRCATRMDNEVIVFGWEGKLKAVSINVDSKAVNQLAIEGETKGKGERCQIVKTSEGRGLVIDGVHFGSFFVEDKQVVFVEWADSEEVVLDRVAAIELEESHSNYAITAKKELALVDVFVEKAPEEEESLPITARQIEADYMKSSIIENDPHQDIGSPLPRSSIKESTPAPLAKQLGPLLAGECMKRRILESKGRMLEETIKKAEKMVLLMCRYGSEDEKRSHISKVRVIREALQAAFQTESNLRDVAKRRSGEDELKDYVLGLYGELNARELELERDD